MKKFFGFFVALFIGAVVVCCTAWEKEDGRSSTGQQKDVVKVQGHPHELLTKLHAEGKWQYPEALLTGTPTDSITFDGLRFASIATTPETADTAVLVIKWKDGKRWEAGDSILAWGFIFDSGIDTISSEDMIRAIAAADASLTALLLNTGVSASTGDTLNYAAGGFGYNHSDKSRVPLFYDLASVEKDPGIGFRFVPPPPPTTPLGQTHVPDHPQQDIDAAIKESQATGVVEHPFNYDTYGYPCYDFDWWSLEPDDDDYRWQSGWYAGYWSFYNKEGLIGPFSYGGAGISQRILRNRSVDGWVFASWSANMSGGYVPAKF